MEVYIFNPNYSHYYAEVVLNEKEWPPITKDNPVYNRPIKQWVYDNIIDFWFFGDGKIWFRHEEDVLAFKLRWEQYEDLRN